MRVKRCRCNPRDHIYPNLVQCYVPSMYEPQDTATKVFQLNVREAQPRIEIYEVSLGEHKLLPHTGNLTADSSQNLRIGDIQLLPRCSQEPRDGMQ